jgi:hypothetical protein
VPESQIARVVRDDAVHGEAPEGTNRKGHGGLAGRLILGGERSNRKAGVVGDPSGQFVHGASECALASVSDGVVTWWGIRSGICGETYGIT